MTTQLPQRERPEAGVRRDRPEAGVRREWESPDVLFEEARRRRRRRWMAGGALTVVAIVVGALIVGMAGGGGGASGRTGDGQPSGSGSAPGTAHATGSRLFAGAPSTQSFYTGPGAACPLAARSRYLPSWSGCVSVMVADVSGDGHRDLVLTYSRLSHVSLGGLTPRERGSNRTRRVYPAEQAMLRIVSSDGHVITTPIAYRTAPFNKTPAQPLKAEASALISVARVSDASGKEIFLETGRISSGSVALAYGLYRGKLVSAGVVLGVGGDSATHQGFQCVAGRPSRLVAHDYELSRGIKVIRGDIYGWWNDTTTTYAWHGPRLVELSRSTVKRRLRPTDRVGAGCMKGIA